MLDRLEKAHHIVRECLGQQALYSASWYNQRVKEKFFEAGEKVRVYNSQRKKGRVPKWQNWYRDVGEIVRKLNDSACLVSCPSWRANKIVHADKLKRVPVFEV